MHTFSIPFIHKNACIFYTLSTKNTPIPRSPLYTFSALSCDFLPLTALGLDSENPLFYRLSSVFLTFIFLSNSAPITANAATAKVLGVGKTFTVKKTTKVSGLSKAEKKIVKVTVNKKKRTVTVKGVKAGKASFKIGKKAYTVKVGATKIAKKTLKTTMTAGTSQTVSVTATAGKGDTIKFASSNKAVLTVNKASAKASTKGIAKMGVKAVKEGTAKLTVSSKNTGVKKSFTIKVVAAAPAPTQAPQVATTPAVTTATATPVTTPAVQATATAGTNTTLAPGQTEVPGTDATLAPGQTEVPGTDATLAPGQTIDPSASQNPDGTQTPDTTQAPTPTEIPQVVSGSVVSIGAVNSQGESIDLNAITKNATIEVTFSEAIDASTVNNGTFTLADASGRNISIPASDVALSPSGKKATVNLVNVGLDKKETYTLTINGVKTYKGANVIGKTVSFTVVNYAVVKNIRLDEKSEDDKLDTNMNTDLTGSTFTASDCGKMIIVTYDELLDKTTVNAANISLTNKTTGERVACDISYGDGKILLKSKSSLISKNLYVLSITGVKTAVNGVAEDMTHIFTVNGVEPLSQAVQVRTLDGTEILAAGTTSVWPKLTAGLKDKATDLTDSTYYAGLQINIAVQENLDATSVAENVLLVEKETKDIVPATATWNAEAKMITLIPKADLKEDTDYQIQYLGGLMTTDYVYLDASKKSDVKANTLGDRDFKTIDATAPEIVSVVCEDGTKGLEAKKSHSFVVTFSEPVTTIDADNVLVVASSLDLSVAGNSTSEDIINVSTVAPVAGTNNTKFKITIPEGTEGDHQLKADKAYKLYIVGKDLMNNDALGMNKSNTGTKKVVKDKGSNFLKKSGVYAFSTENDTTAPKLLGVYDGDPYNGGKDITSTTKTNVNGDGKEFWFVYDEEIALADASKITVEKETAGVWGSSACVATKSLAARTGESKNTMLKVVVDGVTDDANYRIAIEKGAIRDTANETASKCNFTDLYRYAFIGSDGLDNAANVKMYASIYDAMKDADGNTANSDASSKIAIESKFFVVLDETETTGITKDNFIVTDASGNVVSGTVKEVTNSNYAGKTVYSFTPATNLAYDTTYTVVLKDVKDVIGNTIVQKANDFKTVADNAKVVSASIENNAVSVDRQKTITFTLDQEVQLTKGSTVTLVDDASVEAPYTLATSDKKTYTITFGGTDATRLAENTAYTLTINPSTAANKKEIKFITGKSATDDVKPVALGKINCTSVESLIEDAKVTIKADGAKQFYVPYSEAIDVSAAKVKVTLLTPADNTVITDIGVLPLSAVNYTSKAAATGDDVNDALAVTLGTGLAKDNDYKIEITGVKDKAGNAADDITVYATTSDGATGLVNKGLSATGYTYYSDATLNTVIVSVDLASTTSTKTVYAVDNTTKEVIGLEVKGDGNVKVLSSSKADRLISACTATLSSISMKNKLKLASMSTTTETFEFYTDADCKTEVKDLVIDDTAKTIYAKNEKGSTFSFTVKTTDGTSITVGNISEIARSTEDQTAGTKTDTIASIAVSASDGVVTVGSLTSTAPKIASAKMGATANIVLVTFDEAVVKEAVETVANWTYTMGTGVNTTIKSVSYNVTTKTATVTFNAELGAGNGSDVKLQANSSVTDTNGNAIDTSYDEVTISAVTANGDLSTIG